MHPLDEVMKCVVRVQANQPSGAVSTGTGFAYRFAVKEDGTYVPAIVTNKHVVEDAVSVSLPISSEDLDGNPTGRFEVITYTLNDNIVIYHPDDDVDLCAILTAPIHQYFHDKSERASLVYLYKSVVADTETFNDILPLEDVTMIGYPNGIWDSVNNGSIARRGVIATIPSNDYLEKKQFVVDMACFPGSSGSPVFLANFGNYTNRDGNLVLRSRLILLGVLYAGPQHTASGEIVLAPVPTQNKPVSLTSIPNNLGYVIKITELEEIEKIASKLRPNRSASPS